MSAVHGHFIHKKTGVIHLKNVVIHIKNQLIHLINCQLWITSVIVYTIRQLATSNRQLASSNNPQNRPYIIPHSHSKVNTFFRKNHNSITIIAYTITPKPIKLYTQNTHINPTVRPTRTPNSRLTATYLPCPPYTYTHIPDCPPLTDTIHI